MPDIVVQLLHQCHMHNGRLGVQLLEESKALFQGFAHHDVEVVRRPLCIHLWETIAVSDSTIDTPLHGLPLDSAALGGHMLKLYCNLQHGAVSLENVLPAILTAHPMSSIQTAKSSRLMHARPEPLQIAVAA